MAFHIPFNQRRRRMHRAQPVYIGFEAPARPKKKFNWWGFNGLVLSMGSFLLAGFPSPVALLVSLVGLKKTKGPRKAAAVGTVFSLIGIALATSILGITFAEHQQRQNRRAQRAYKMKLTEDMKGLSVTMADAKSELKEYQDSNGLLPDPVFGNVLTIKHLDPWGNELRYESGNESCVIRSSGPDQVFDSGDDIVESIKGELEEMSSLYDLDSSSNDSVDADDEESVGSTSDKNRSGYSRH